MLEGGTTSRKTNRQTDKHLTSRLGLWPSENLEKQEYTQSNSKAFSVSLGITIECSHSAVLYEPG